MLFHVSLYCLCYWYVSTAQVQTGLVRTTCSSKFFKNRSQVFGTHENEIMRKSERPKRAIQNGCRCSDDFPSLFGTQRGECWSSIFGRRPWRLCYFGYWLYMFAVQRKLQNLTQRSGRLPNFDSNIGLLGPSWGP